LLHADGQCAHDGQSIKKCDQRDMLDREAARDAERQESTSGCAIRRIIRLNREASVTSRIW